MLLKTEDVCKTYTSGDTVVEALKNICVSIEPGTLTMLRGRSGSGKTTLMNLLGALDQPTSGKIYFRDQEITALSEAKRDLLRRREMGFVFQSVALISNMSAYENVEFGLRLAGAPARRTARARGGMPGACRFGEAHDAPCARTFRRRTAARCHCSSYCAQAWAYLRR